MRSNRISDEIRKLLSDIFIKTFPSKYKNLITITKVEVSSDLKLAKVFLSIYNNQRNKENINNEFKFIKNNKNILRYHLGRILSIKYIPDLRFYLDDQIDIYQKINSLI